MTTVDDDDTRAVLAALDTFHAAARTGDVAALGEVLADDLTYVHSSGKLQDRTEALEDFAQRSVDFGCVEALVRIYGNIALIDSIIVLQHNGKQLSILFVWMRGANGWRMLARQATGRS
jgi:ketosteroid isomerase-like protein